MDFINNTPFECFFGDAGRGRTSVVCEFKRGHDINRVLSSRTQCTLYVLAKDAYGRSVMEVPFAAYRPGQGVFIHFPKAPEITTVELSLLPSYTDIWRAECSYGSG